MRCSFLLPDSPAGWPKRSRACIVTLFGFCALLAGRLPAQGPSPDGGNANIPQVRAEAPEIVLDLVARDKKNRPILNLGAADISVTDGGTPVPLSGLHLVTAQSGAETRIAIVFDGLSPESAKVARDFVGRLLTAAPPQSSFAVLGIDRGLRLIEDYTTDRAAARAATLVVPDGIPQNSLSEAEKALVTVAQNGTLPNGANAGVEDRANAKMMLNALEDSQKIVQDRHSPSALAGMMALARAQQSLAGRKIILFFSEGLRPNSKTEDVSKDVVETANRAGVSIYTIDTKGVATKSFDVLTMMYQPGHGPAARSTPGTTGMFNTNLEGNIAQASGTENNAVGANHSQEDLDKAKGSSLAFLANGTGGFAMSTGDDLRKPLERLVGDIGSYYEASYTPALKEYDGQFHPLEIHAVRTGITVRSRSGYFALPPDAAGSAPVRPSEAPLLKLLAQGTPPNEVGFNQAVLHVEAGSGGRATNEIAVEVPVSHLELRSDQQTMLYAARASILAEVKDRSGVVVERFHEEIARNGALESIEGARTGVVTLERHFAVAPGDYVLESAVLDRISGKAGTMRTEFTVPAAESGPWLSDVVLVRRMQPMSGAPDPLEPLAYQNARAVPNLAHEVPAGTQQISFLVRVKRDASAGDGTLALDVERDGKTISRSASKVAATPGSTTSLNMASIQAGNLSGGDYRAVFTFTQGTKSASRDIAFTLEGNPGDKARADVADEDTTDVPADLGDSGTGRFTPAAAMHAPGKATEDALLSGARERAGGYLGSLMNFKCLEITDRYLDHRGNGKAHHDKIAEMLTYENHEESRKVLEVNGSPVSANNSVDMSGARLEGAFGGVLQIVFELSSDAHFVWKQNGTLDGASVEVFDYTVDAKHSHFSVTPLPAPSVLVPFHGQVFIDAATRGVRRITIEGDNIPADSPIRGSSLSIDYDYVTMNDHDYLVPVRGEMRMHVGKTEKILHRIEFRDYHRFGSQTRIISVNP